MSRVQLSAKEARQLALTAQGFAQARPGPGGPRAQRNRLMALSERLKVLQLDAVNVLARTQLLVAFSRVGEFSPALFTQLSQPGGPWFEYWGHAASLMPLSLYPLQRWRMERHRRDVSDSALYQQRRRQWRSQHRAYLDSLLEEIRIRGPLSGSQLSEPRRRSGEWWDRRSDGRRGLEMLFDDGILAAWRGPSFERIYDLAERVIPREVLAQPFPDRADAQRALVGLAAQALGVATELDLRSYFSMGPAQARVAIAELVQAGGLLPAQVEGWEEPALLSAGARLATPRRGASLISPFDSLIWTRERTERLFGVRYRIEIYVPEQLRAHGYYVLPLLLGDRLRARLDLKADRRRRALLVQAAHLEPGERSSVVAPAAAGELHRLASWLQLERVEVRPAGGMAGALEAAL